MRLLVYKNDDELSNKSLLKTEYSVCHVSKVTREDNIEFTAQHDSVTYSIKNSNVELTAQHDSVMHSIENFNVELTAQHESAMHSTENSDIEFTA